MNINDVLVDWAGYPGILGGDYNAVMNININRSHPPILGAGSIKQAEALARWSEG